MQDLADKLSGLLRERGLKLALAESCTGGLIASLITALPGASDIFDCGFVTYSNDSKKSMLGVTDETLTQHGAVSAECASSMAYGALSHSQADIAASVTGVAGPDGGTKEKPVGLVFLGFAAKDGKFVTKQCNFEGTRQEIQQQSGKEALKGLIAIIEGQDP